MTSFTSDWGDEATAKRVAAAAAATASVRAVQAADLQSAGRRARSGLEFSGGRGEQMPQRVI